MMKDLYQKCYKNKRLQMIIQNHMINHNMNDHNQQLNLH